MIWGQIAVFVISFLYTAFLAPKPEQERLRPSSLDDLSVPRASQGDPIPYILGKVRLKSPNTLWYGDFDSKEITKKVKTGMFSSKRVQTGFEYYLGLDLALCLGSGVKLHRMWIGKDVVYNGELSGDDRVYFNRRNLFGGKDSGGGFRTSMQFYEGSFTQERNDYLTRKIRPEVPAYVGISHLVLERAYIGNAAQLRAFSFELSRQTNGLSLTNEQLLSEDGNDINLAEMLYQLLVEGWGGLDFDSTKIDVDSFREAAATLAEEGNFGSIQVTKPTGGKGVIEEVLRQIDGIMYQDPETSNAVLKLIRFNYDLDDLELFDEDSVLEVRNFSRSSWEDTLNQVRTTYVDRQNDYNNATSMTQDLANINAQGRVRSTNINFPLCYDPELATRLATREQSQLSVPLFRATLKLNRRAARLRPGQPFLFSWKQFNLEQVVMRVKRFHIGSLTSGEIEVEVLQDYFATDLTVFAAPERTLFDPIDRRAADPLIARLVEPPRWFMDAQGVVSTPREGQFYPLVLAQRANGRQQGYDAFLDDVRVVDNSGYNNTARVLGAIAKGDGFADGRVPSITVDLPSPDEDWLQPATLSEIRVGYNLCFLGNELVAFTNVTDNGDGTYTLSPLHRALLDTEYDDHADGATLIRVDVNGLSTGSVALAQTTFELESYTGNDRTLEEERPTISVVPTDRYSRPAPPDYLQINNSRLPAPVSDLSAVEISWRERSAAVFALEADAPHSASDITGYRISIYADENLHSTSDHAGSPATLDLTGLQASEVRVEVNSINEDNLLSNAPATNTFSVT